MHEGISPGIIMNLMLFPLRSAVRLTSQKINDAANDLHQHHLSSLDFYFNFILRKPIGIVSKPAPSMLESDLTALSRSNLNNLTY